MQAELRGALEETHKVALAEASEAREQAEARAEELQRQVASPRGGGMEAAGRVARARDADELLSLSTGRRRRRRRLPRRGFARPGTIAELLRRVEHYETVIEAQSSKLAEAAQAIAEMRDRPPVATAPASPRSIRR